VAVAREPVSAGTVRAEGNPFAGLKPGRWYRIGWAGQNRGGDASSYGTLGKLEWVHPEGRYAVFRTRVGYAFCAGRGHLAAGAQVLPATLEGGRSPAVQTVAPQLVRKGCQC
jgi:hypothetical protein